MKATDNAPQKRAAVLGHPIDHSRSPALHTAAYQYLRQAIDYGRHDVTVEALPDFFAQTRGEIPESADWLGFSVTMPLKGAMVPLMDHLSERVQRLGFLNTVVFDADGSSTGHNTDVDGIVEALRFAGDEASAVGGTMGILGGGGTAAAAILAAHLMNMDGVTLMVRSPEKAADHVDLARSYGLAATVSHLDDFAAQAPEHRALVSTLPPRAADDLAGSLSAATLPPLLDAAYDPWPSQLAIAWNDGGGQVVSGLEMLLYQAVEQVRLFTARLDVGKASVDWAAMTAAMAEAVGLPSRN